MRILVTRPEPDASQLGERLAALGHDVYIEPMIEVSFDTGEAIELDEVQALIATSRNGVRALSHAMAANPVLEIARRLPFYAVGPGTAAAARAAGIETVITGGSDAAALAGLLAEQAQVNGGALLHLAGDRLAFPLADDLAALGFTVLQPVVYRSVVATTFSDELVQCFTGGEIEAVMLLSPRTAQTFATLIERHDLTHTVKGLTFFCLSDAVAHQIATLGAPGVAVAKAPNLQEMLCLVAEAAAKSARSGPM